MKTTPNPYSGDRYLAEFFSQAVLLQLHFAPSYRDVEEFLPARGIVVLPWKNDDLQKGLAFFPYKTHFVIDERLEFIALIEDRLDSHLLTLSW